ARGDVGARRCHEGRRISHASGTTSKARSARNGYTENRRFEGRCVHAIYGTARDQGAALASWRDRECRTSQSLPYPKRSLVGNAVFETTEVAVRVRSKRFSLRRRRCGSERAISHA